MEWQIGDVLTTEEHKADYDLEIVDKTVLLGVTQYTYKVVNDVRGQLNPDRTYQTHIFQGWRLLSRRTPVTKQDMESMI